MKLNFKLQNEKSCFVLKINFEENLNLLQDTIKYKHDLTSALSTFSIAIDEIKSGYKFDDELAVAKLETLQKSLDKLKNQAEILNQLYSFIIENLR